MPFAGRSVPGVLEQLARMGLRARRPRGEGSAFTVSLMTSGTTGRPKLVRHNLESLLGRIPRTVGSAMNCGQRWLISYQPTTFAGLQVILTALCTGAAVVRRANRSPRGLFAAAEQFAATHISGTPTFWRSFLLAARPDRCRYNRSRWAGSRSTSLRSTGWRNGFRKRGSPIYASSEAGSLFSVHDGSRGISARWLDAAPGVGLRIPSGVLEVQSP